MEITFIQSKDKLDKYLRTPNWGGLYTRYNEKIYELDLTKWKQKLRELEEP